MNVTFSPYLGFDGTCAEAMRFYSGLFGGTDLEIMTYAEAPPDAQMGGDPTRVMHSQFTLNGVPLMAADGPPGKATAQTGVSVYHGAPTLERAGESYAALAAGGSAIMPFGPTFWSPGFGMLTDRFGTSWIISLAAPA